MATGNVLLVDVLLSQKNNHKGDSHLQRNIGGGEPRTGNAIFGVTRQPLRLESEEGFTSRVDPKKRTVRIVFNWCIGAAV
jgi:hypothetical protein